MHRATPRIAAVALGLGMLVAPFRAAAAASFTPRPWSPQTEAQNFSKVTERQATYDTPGYQVLLRTVSTQNAIVTRAEQVNDRGRAFADHVCSTGDDGCAGDARLYEWQATGYGIVQPVYFTARDGATISGHVWATRSGPAHRPGVVITDGSVQANEQMYWYAAQALAKDGYVVLTFDPQGQGQSDTPGESPDRQEGVPAQSDGRPFFDGTEDAINFFLSSPSHPYQPVPSCSTGTSHATKQDIRVAEGFDNAFDPFSAILDGTRIGIAGHSYGAAGVSYIAQWDPRVKAVVAWDNLGGTNPQAGFNGSSQPLEQPCPANPADRTVPPITKPGLGISADYGLPPTPNPEPLPARPGGQDHRVAGLQRGRRGQRGADHPGWQPSGLQLHPERGLRRIAARRRSDRLEHHRLV